MKEEELKQMDKEELLGVIKAQRYEIERLNKECDTYMKISMQKQQRIDKAIEYIRTHRYPTNYCFSEEDLDKQDLINILEGE